MIGLGSLAGLASGGLSFLTGPLGKWAIIGVALVAWTMYQRDQAADKARETCQAERLQNTINELRRQRNAAQESLKRAAEAAAQSKEELKELREDYDEIREALGEEAGSAPCIIPDDVIRRLRDIK